MRTAGGLVVVHVDALQLEVGVAMVGPGGVHAVLVADDLRAGRSAPCMLAGGMLARSPARPGGPGRARARGDTARDGPDRTSAAVSAPAPAWSAPKTGSKAFRAISGWLGSSTISYFS